MALSDEVRKAERALDPRKPKDNIRVDTDIPFIQTLAVTVGVTLLIVLCCCTKH